MSDKMIAPSAGDNRGVAKNFLAGLLFAAFGIAALLFARHYTIGTVTQMGPGFFPMIVGGLMTVLGLALAAKSIRNADVAAPVVGREIRAVVGIILAVLAFGALIEPWGLLAALIALMGIGRLAGGDGSLLELAVIAIVVSLGTILIFVVGLQIPINVLPQ